MKNTKNLFKAILFVLVPLFVYCNSENQQKFIKEYVDEMPGIMKPLSLGKPYVNIDSFPDCEFCYEADYKENWINYINKDKYQSIPTYIKYKQLPSDDDSIVTVVKIWYQFIPSNNTHHQSIHVYQKSAGEWREISDAVLPKEYTQFFYRTTADIIDSVIVLNDLEHNLKAKMIWRNGIFVFEKPLEANFGEKPDLWKNILTDEVDNEFREAWNKYKSAIRENDTAALIRLIHFPLIFGEYSYNEQNYEFEPDSIITIANDQLVGNADLLFSVYDLNEAEFNALRDSLHNDNYKLPREQIYYVANYGGTNDDLMSTNYKLFFNKIDGKVLLEIIERSTQQLEEDH